MVSLSLQRLLCNNFFYNKKFLLIFGHKVPCFPEEGFIFTFKTRVNASNNVLNRKPCG